MHFAALLLSQGGFSCNVIATDAQVTWHFLTSFIYGVLLNARWFCCCLWLAYYKLLYSRRGISLKRVKRYGVANSEFSLSNHDVGEACEQPGFSPSAGPGNEPCLSL